MNWYGFEGSIYFRRSTIQTSSWNLLIRRSIVLVLSIYIIVIFYLQNRDVRDSSDLVELKLILD